MIEETSNHRDFEELLERFGGLLDGFSFTQF
jgi:hypothetical protein